MPERQKSIVAAILAVHSGRISPEQAAAMLEDPGQTSSLVEFDDAPPSIRLSSGDGESMELPFIDVLENPEMQRKALAEIGIGDAVQETLFNFGTAEKGGNGETEMRVLRETLKTVATTGRKLAESEIQPATGDYTGSESPTQAPRKNTTLRLTTSKFLPNFGMQDERYDIKEEHARGGMGRVLLARDKAVGREVALKELLPGMSGGSSLPASVPAGATNDSGGIVERFLREAKITGQLEHPNIVPVYEIGQYPDGNYYYTMRFIRGKTLAEKLRDIRKDEGLDRDAKLAARIKLLDMFVDVCNAIAYAHSKGVIHRDIKPDNIMVGDYGETLVLDWGLARIKGQEDKAMRQLQKGTLALSQSLYQADSEALTLDGSIVGTPAYMAPEQARGELEQIDEQSDVYALGAVLYQILTGHPPYEGPMAALIVQSVLAGPPVKVRSREQRVPPELEALVERAMARDKKDRLPSALKLASEVKAFRDGRTIGSYSYSMREMVARFVHQHRTSVSFGFLCALLLVAGAIVFVQQLAQERDAALVAHHEAETERVRAQAALDDANRERAERERLEREQLEREQRDFIERAREAEQLLGTIEGMRIDPALRDLERRAQHYENELAGPPAVVFLELQPDEQISNGVLLSNVLGYVSAKQNLIELLTGPAGAQMPEVFAQFDLEVEREYLNNLRVTTAMLARVNGDFTLAEFLISGATLPADVLRAEREAITRTRSAMLQLHADRIDEALFDVRSGIQREGRPDGAPTFDEYVRQLSQYREAQTVDILGRELERLTTRSNRWSRNDVLLAKLICRVLGRVEQPGRTVPMLAAFLEQTENPEIIMDVSRALADTDSGDALEVLVAQIRARGLDYWSELLSEMRTLPLTSRLRRPESVDDMVDAAIARRSRGDAAQAAELASRALNLQPGHVESLYVRALARMDQGDNAAALADLDRAIERDPMAYEALIARSQARNVYLEGTQAIEDLTQAIELKPESPRAYLHRARMLHVRAQRAAARNDYERALALAPDSIDIRLEYGEFLRFLGREHFPAAHEQFTRVIEQAPDDYRGWSYRCVLNRDMSFGQCITDGREATRLNPNDARAYNFMSQALYGLSRHTEGIEAATNAVRADPDEWMAHYYRAIHSIQLQSSQDSLARREGADRNWSSARAAMVDRIVNDFREALRVNPQDFRSWYLMADQLLQQSRHEEAREALGRALELAPFGGQGATIGMETWGVRRHLLECEGAEIAKGTPNTLGEIARVIHYYVGMGERPLINREHLRSAIEWTNRGRQLNNPSHPMRDRYEFAVAESRLIETLRTNDFFMDSVEHARVRFETGEFIAPLEYFHAATAFAQQARQHLDDNVVVLGADEDARRAAMEQLQGRDFETRSRAAAALKELAFEYLNLALNNGFRDLGRIPVDHEHRRGPLAVLHDDPRFVQWMEGVNNSDRTPPPDPGMPRSAVVIDHVVENGPAWIAGLRRHDVIASIKGEPIHTSDDFIRMLTSMQAGEEYTVLVHRYTIRDGRLVYRTGPNNQPVLDENGMKQWEYEEVELTFKQGFLGIRPENAWIVSTLSP